MRKFKNEEIKAMTKQQAITEIGNTIYEASTLFEQLERVGKLTGNGHHIRQAISSLASEMMDQRFITEK